LNFSDWQNVSILLTHLDEFVVLNVPFGQLILTQTFELHLQAEVQKKLMQQLQQTEVVVEVGDSYSDILRGRKKKSENDEYFFPADSTHQRKV